MSRTIFWATAIALAAAILQSTLLARLAILHVVPDLALGVLIFTAYVNGSMAGQLTGFISGFALDFLSASPMGFNALVRTVIGALSGLMKGTFFLDTFILPMVLCALGTLAKAAIIFVLHLLFGGAVPSYSFTEPTLWIETAVNTVTAPALFALLKTFKRVLYPRKDA